MSPRVATAGPSPLRAWWLAIRPATLWAAVAPVAAGTAQARLDGHARPRIAAFALAVALLLQVGCNLVNDAADHARGVDGEGRLGPRRAAAQGWLSTRALWLGAALSLGGACALGAVLLLDGPPALWIVGAAAVMAALAYTAGPLPLGYLGLGDLLVLVFFGPVAVCGTYGLQVGCVPAHVWLAGLAVGALATAILVVNNLRDRAGDARAGKRTLAARFGAGFARKEYAGLVVAAYVIAGWLAVAADPAWWWAMGTLPLAARAIGGVWRRDGRDLNPLLGVTARLELVFVLALCLGAAW